MSDKCSGDSIATFIRCDKLKSDNMFHKLDFNFFCENLLSTDAIITGIVIQIVASALRFGYIAPIMSVVANSCSCVVIFSFGC